MRSRFALTQPPGFQPVPTPARLAFLDARHQTVRAVHALTQRRVDRTMHRMFMARAKNASQSAPIPRFRDAYRQGLSV